MGFPSGVSIAGSQLGRPVLHVRPPARRPLGIVGALAICLGGSLVLGALIASSVLTPDAAAAAFVLLVAVTSSCTSVPAALATAALAFLFEDGFLYGTRGVLTWHGSEDLTRLFALLCIATASSALGRWVQGPKTLRTSPGDE